MTHRKPDAYLVRFGELALKKRNRNRFVDDLVKILKPRLKAIAGRIEIRHQKIIIHSEAEPEAVKAVFSHVYGITSVSPIWRTNHNVEAIESLAWELMEPYVGSGKSFAVRGRRAFKRFPMKTPQIERHLADSILAKGLDLPVNLKTPDLTLGFSIQPRGETWMWLHSWKCLGGLPVSEFTKHGLLLSGGIDSPVAGNLIQKRGGSLMAIYFHTPPYTVPAAEEKVFELAEVLAKFQNGLDLHVVNFTKAMQTLRSECDPRYTVILSRRLMMRVASEILHREGGKSIITGESLGQVASQTIENITVIGHGVELPILRPLIGMDKIDIVERAQQIGSYDISIRPFDDCCSLFSPKNPVTKAHLGATQKMETKVDLEALVSESVNATQKTHIHSF